MYWTHFTTNGISWHGPLVTVGLKVFNVVGRIKGAKFRKVHLFLLMPSHTASRKLSPHLSLRNNFLRLLHKHVACFGEYISQSLNNVFFLRKKICLRGHQRESLTNYKYVLRSQSLEQYCLRTFITLNVKSEECFNVSLVKVFS